MSDESTLMSLGRAFLVVLLLLGCLMGFICMAVLYDEVLFIQRKAFFAFGFFFSGFTVGWTGEILFGISKEKE